MESRISDVTDQQRRKIPQLRSPDITGKLPKETLSRYTTFILTYFKKFFKGFIKKTYNLEKITKCAHSKLSFVDVFVSTEVSAGDPVSVSSKEVSVAALSAASELRRKFSSICSLSALLRN